MDDYLLEVTKMKDKEGKLVSAEFTVEKVAKIKEIAELQYTTTSAIIRRAVDEYIERYEKKAV